MRRSAPPPAARAWVRPSAARDASLRSCTRSCAGADGGRPPARPRGLRTSCARRAISGGRRIAAIAWSTSPRSEPRARSTDQRAFGSPPFRAREDRAFRRPRRRDVARRPFDLAALRSRPAVSRPALQLHRPQWTEAHPRSQCSADLRRARPLLRLSRHGAGSERARARRRPSALSRRS